MHAICCVCNLKNRKERSGSISFLLGPSEIRQSQSKKVSYFNRSWFPEYSHLSVQLENCIWILGLVCSTFFFLRERKIYEPQ